MVRGQRISGESSVSMYSRDSEIVGKTEIVYDGNSV